MAFSINSEMINGIAKITVAGELDASVAGQFRDEINLLAGQNPRRLVLVMDKLDYMASAGLRMLVFARQKMGADVDIYIIAPTPAVRETIEMTGFHHSVILLDNYDAALIEALGGQ